VWASGLTYTGAWKRNLKTGYGVMTWPSGAKYEGMWNRNRINGRGTFTWPDGDRYEGEWVNNCRRGKGVLYLNKGKLKVDQDWDEQVSPALADLKDLKKFPEKESDKGNEKDKEPEKETDD